MNDRIFLDTNVLIYASIKDKSGDKYESAISLLRKIEGKNVFISTQIINEYYNTLIRKNVNDSVIQKNIRELVGLVAVAPIDLGTVLLSWEIRSKYGFSIWDSLVVATALKKRCNILYSEDLQHRQMIEKRLVILNPFQ